MTLVVAGIKDGVAFMVSDAIASTPIELRQSKEEISYPTKPKGHISKRMIAVELVQKVTEISSGFYVGCSGDANCAARFISFFRQTFSKKHVTKQMLDQAYSDYFSFHRADRHIFSTLTLFQDEEFTYLASHGDVWQEEIPDLGIIYIIGSGTPNFVQYLRDTPPDKRMVGVDLHENLRVVSYVTEYVMNIMAIQNATGLGISEGWGGAFELVFCQESHLLKKLDNMIFVYLEWDEHDGEIQTRQIGKRYFQYYEGRNLIVVSQYKNEAASIEVVFPVDASIKSGQTCPTAHAPQMLCMLLINRKTRVTRTHLEYNQNGFESCGVSYSENAGYAVRFNTEQMKIIIGGLRNQRP